MIDTFDKWYKWFVARDFRREDCERKHWEVLKKCNLEHSILNNSMRIKRMGSKDIRLKKGRFKEGRKDTSSRNSPQSWIKLIENSLVSIGFSLVSGMVWFRSSNDVTGHGTSSVLTQELLRGSWVAAAVPELHAPGPGPSGDGGQKSLRMSYRLDWFMWLFLI